MTIADDVRRADGPIHLRVPPAGAARTSRSRRSGGSSGCPARRIRPSTASGSTAPAARSTRASSPTTTSTGRRSARRAGAFVDLMTSACGAGRGRAARSRRVARAGGGVAVELLLLPGGPAAAGLPVLVRRRRPGRAPPRPCGALSGLRRALRQPRLAGARRRAVRERRADRRRRPRLRRTTPSARSRSSTPSSTRPASTSGACTSTEACSVIPATGQNTARRRKRRQ